VKSPRRFIIFLALTFSIFSNIRCLDRPGKQLYIDFVGQPLKNSTKLINSQDRQDFGGGSAYLYFQTTPAELNRILTQREYSKKIISKQSAIEVKNIKYSGEIPKWWTPSLLGDSCVVYENFDDNIKRAELIYCSFDSTVVYYIDNRW